MTVDLYPRAVASVIESQSGSTSRLQRRLELGYNAACRLIERMQMEGIVSGPDFNGRREVLTRLVPPLYVADERPSPFQQRVAPWMKATFGPEISADRGERNHRFLEEALELVQANGCSASEAHQLVDYVFGRPIGSPPQEVGGVMVTLAALCLASDVDMHEAAETELTRVWTKVEQIRAKQAAKPKHSPLAEQSAPPSDTSGYQLAFYELASLMNIGARAQAPGHVWRREMLPRLTAVFGAMPAAPSALLRSIAELEAFERDGISLCEVENEVSFTEGLSLCLHELKRLRDTPFRDQVRLEIINAPETADFMAGVPIEAAHQRERWGADHDAGKTPFDWFWLIGYLAQKAADAAVRGDQVKAKHHTISAGAALANWHAALAGVDTAMRPGITPPFGAVS